MRSIAFNGGDHAQIRAFEILLKAHAPGVYRDNAKIEHAVSIGREDLRSLSDEELNAELARYASADAAE